MNKEKLSQSEYLNNLIFSIDLASTNTYI